MGFPRWPLKQPLTGSAEEALAKGQIGSRVPTEFRVAILAFLVVFYIRRLKRISYPLAIYLVAVSQALPRSCCMHVASVIGLNHERNHSTHGQYVGSK
jgi:hypothetical protein